VESRDGRRRVARARWSEETRQGKGRDEKAGGCATSSAKVREKISAENGQEKSAEGCASITTRQSRALSGALADDLLDDAVRGIQHGECRRANRVALREAAPNERILRSPMHLDGDDRDVRVE
jgi:hypothetical protein